MNCEAKPTDVTSAQLELLEEQLGVCDNHICFNVIELLM